jgi:O-antigen/teichoic acid export membrane protein
VNASSSPEQGDRSELGAEPASVALRRRADLPAGSLRGHMARGTILNALFLVGLNALALLKGIVVAGLIGPSEYGVWGIVSLVLLSLITLKSVGVGDKYIQQDEPDQELAFQKAFTLELVSAGVLVCMMGALLPILALAYGQSEILAPGFVLMLVLPGLALQLPIWTFYRRMQFLKLRVFQAVDPVTGAAVTVALAVAGLGYWSAVVGVVVGTWAGALAAMAASPHRPALRYEHGTMREYVSFSGPLVLAAANTVVVFQVVPLAGEAAEGLVGAGAITLAMMLSTFSERIEAAITQTLYPAVAAVRGSKEVLRESFEKSNRLALICIVPIGVGLAVFVPDLVEFGIGDRWEPAIVVIQIFALTASIRMVGFSWGVFYKAEGRTRPVATVAAISLGVFLLALVPLVNWLGLEGVAAAVALMTLTSLAGRSYYILKFFPGFDLVRHGLRAMLPTVPAVAAVLVARLVSGDDRTLALALGELALYVVVVGAATIALERQLLRELLGYLRGQGTTDLAPAVGG